MTPIELWRSLPPERGTIDLIRVGDFWETFGQHAVRLAAICQLTLVRRIFSGQREFCAGVPYSLGQRYIDRVVQAGHRVRLVNWEGGAK